MRPIGWFQQAEFEDIGLSSSRRSIHVQTGRGGAGYPQFGQQPFFQCSTSAASPRPVSGSIGVLGLYLGSAAKKSLQYLGGGVLSDCTCRLHFTESLQKRIVELGKAEIHSGPRMRVVAEEVLQLVLQQPAFRFRQWWLNRHFADEAVQAGRGREGVFAAS